MQRFIVIILGVAIALALAIRLIGCENKQSAVKVGVILPMDHMALREITKGFETALRADYHQPIIFKVANAQNDANLQRAIIQQMAEENYSIIAPIGTSATQMAISMVKKQNIVGLAAEYTGADRNGIQGCNFGIVDDQINDEQIVAFIHQVYPRLKELTLVHSATDKIFPEVKIVQNAGVKYGIKVQSVTVQTLSDLYTIANALPQSTEAIFILKDSMIASGVDTLVQVANERKIPLITSDDGTVQNGAGFALGVHERDIGAKGGELAAKVLNGTPICQLPIVKMTHPSVFINTGALKAQGQNAELVKNAATQLHYSIEYFSNGVK